MAVRRTFYLDHNASAPVDPRVLERFLEVERKVPGNPGSLHAAGRAARAALEDARQEVAESLSVAPDEVVFLATGTEANNLVVAGGGDPRRPVLLAEVEHASVLEPARRRGIERLEVDEAGHAVLRRPVGQPGLLCLVHGQNEVGTLQPIARAGELARELAVPLHVDAAQTLGRITLGEVLDHASTIVLSCHKAGGLKGSAVLVVRRGTELRPLLHGGGQEAGLRPGTPSPALAASAARTIALAVAEQEARAAAMAASRERFAAGLRASGVPHRVLTPPDSLPNTLMVAFPGIDGRKLLPALDLQGVQVSQGSACSSGSPTPPRVLRAMGLPDDETRSCVRFSFGWQESTSDVEAAAATTVEVLHRLMRTA